MIKIFIVEDDRMYGMILQEAMKSNNHDITIFQSGQEFLDNLHQNPDIVSLDYNLPDIPGTEILKRIKDYNPNIGIIIVSGQEEVSVVVETYKLGADSYIIKNKNTIVELQNAIKHVSKSIILQKEVEELREKIIDRNKYNMLIGESPALLKVIKLIQKVENSNILTLITGESGTGKDVVAKAIHYNSSRKRKPFIAVNVAAIPPDLIESEMFGHEKGAFTGANSKRKGKFEEADGGTIFLDEIGEMDISMQTKLLRVLQDNCITRLGSSKDIKLDIRVLAATNKNLGERVKEGKFREDLYYRIQGFLIHLPPLRERGNDIIILSNYFMKEYCTQNRILVKNFEPEALKILLDHPWTGNIRELKSVVERAAIISDSSNIKASDLIFSDAI